MRTGNNIGATIGATHFPKCVAPGYPAYKDSGVAWLGEIPSHWEVKRLKYVAPEAGEKLPEKPDDLPYLGLENIESGTGRLLLDNPMENVESTVVAFRNGDVLFGKLRPYLAKVVCVGFNGVGTSEILVLRPHSGESRFIFYYMLSKAVIDTVNGLTYGAKMPRANSEQIANLPFPLPPLPEQRAIAAFLDERTAALDAAIAEYRRLSDLLQEQRAALISRAVTQGLDPDAPRKDSGIAWLGEIPSHWEVKPFKYAVCFQEGPGIMASDFEDSGVPLLRIGNMKPGKIALEGCNFLDPNNVESRWKHFRLDLGDLLISCSATTGIVSEVGEDAVGAIPYTGLIRLKPIASITIVDFVRWLVVSKQYISQIDALKSGVAIQHYGPTHLSQTSLAFPPLPEQRAIAAYLDEQTARIDAARAEIETAIAHLEEYRAALIAAAVTGKIDVRYS